MKNFPYASMPTAEELYLALLEKIRIAYPGDQKNILSIAGIYRGGAWIAQRLAEDLGLGDAGSINVALHRDDYASKGLHASAPPTHCPFTVNGREILLIDDVLYTGRTVRAAINEIFDFGRPLRVRLGVLVNRTEFGMRELPYAADFSGIELILPHHQILTLQQQDNRFVFTIEP